VADAGQDGHTGHALPLPAIVLGTAWLAWFGVLQWSVVRFRVPIVLTLTVCAALLAWWLARRGVGG
jgi:hypothetical protein